MDRLRQLRRKLGLNQKQLGDILGVSQAVLSGWERGTRRPDIDMLSKTADYLGVSTDYLLERTDDPTPRKRALRAVPESRDFEMHLAGGQSYDNLTMEGKMELYKFYKYLQTRYGKADESRDD